MPGASGAAGTMRTTRPAPTSVTAAGTMVPVGDARSVTLGLTTVAGSSGSFHSISTCGFNGADDEVGEMRMIVVADSELLTDPVLMQFEGNQLFALDGMKWLLGDEAIAGAINTEADEPIQHTRKQDQVWFYSTILLAPALVVGFGMWFTRKQGQRKGAVRAEAKS